MSYKATQYVKSATSMARRSDRASRLARAKDAAVSAEKAALRAVAAAKEAVAAVKAADPKAAAAAAQRATSAKHAAESHALLAESFANPKDAPAAVRRSTSENPVNFLVVRNGRIIATFLNEDDALLFESELADLDVAHGAADVTCEVRSRGGHRVGGYLLAGGKIVTFVEEDKGGAKPAR